MPYKKLVHTTRGKKRLEELIGEIRKGGLETGFQIDDIAKRVFLEDSCLAEELELIPNAETPRFIVVPIRTLLTAENLHKANMSYLANDAFLLTWSICNLAEENLLLRRTEPLDALVLLDDPDFIKVHKDFRGKYYLASKAPCALDAMNPGDTIFYNSLLFSDDCLRLSGHCEKLFCNDCLDHSASMIYRVVSTVPDD